jgi:hypothetical protein
MQRHRVRLAVRFKILMTPRRHRATKGNTPEGHIQHKFNVLLIQMSTVGVCPNRRSSSVFKTVTRILLPEKIMTNLGVLKIRPVCASGTAAPPFGCSSKTRFD